MVVSSGKELDKLERAAREAVKNDQALVSEVCMMKYTHIYKRRQWVRCYFSYSSLSPFFVYPHVFLPDSREIFRDEVHVGLGALSLRFMGIGAPSTHALHHMTACAPALIVVSSNSSRSHAHNVTGNYDLLV